jgi:hypothetical protein
MNNKYKQGGEISLLARFVERSSQNQYSMKDSKSLDFSSRANGARLEFPYKYNMVKKHNTLSKFTFASSLQPPHH